MSHVSGPNAAGVSDDDEMAKLKDGQVRRVVDGSFRTVESCLKWNRNYENVLQLTLIK